MPKHTGNSTDDLLTKLSQIETDFLNNASELSGPSDECDENASDNTSWSAEDGSEKNIPADGDGTGKAGSDEPAAGSSKGRCGQTQVPRPQRCRDTRFRVIRGTSSTCPKNIVSLRKIVKYTNRLIFSLNELNTEAARLKFTCEQRAALDDLINKVKWFLKDLEQSTESSDQLTVLVNKYDVYRTEYYSLRGRIKGDRGADRNVRRRHRSCPSKCSTKCLCARDRASGEDPCTVAEAVDSYVVVTLDRDDDPNCKGPVASKELDAANECPEKAAKKSSNYYYVWDCFGLPCRFFAYFWRD